MKKKGCFTCDDHRCEDSGDYCAALNWVPLSMNDIPLANCPKFLYTKMSVEELQALYNQSVLEEFKHCLPGNNIPQSITAQKIKVALYAAIVKEAKNK
jgi:hypothetical protein